MGPDAQKHSREATNQAVELLMSARQAAKDVEDREYHGVSQKSRRPRSEKTDSGNSNYRRGFDSHNQRCNERWSSRIRLFLRFIQARVEPYLRCGWQMTKSFEIFLESVLGSRRI